MTKATAYRLATLAATLCLAFPAGAQETTTPQMTTATYTAWTLRCDNTAGTPPHRICEVAQTIAAADGNRAIAQIVIGKPTPDGPAKLIVQVPNGVWLPSNVTLALDAKTAVTATYRRCVQLCFADVDLDKAITDAFKAGKGPAKLVFADASQHAVELPVSLDGFSAAFDASLAGVGEK